MNKQGLQTLVNEVMANMARTSLKTKLKKLIAESMEEIKHEDADCLAGEMAELDKMVKEHDKKCSIDKDDTGNYNMNGDPIHNISIRPMSAGIYDVVYFKDTADREKKLNLKLKELKAYVTEKLKNKNLNYVKTAYNKTADNTNDKVEKTENPIHHKFAKKEIKDTKNDNKDYNELPVKDEDMPEKPMREVEKFKKQNETPIKGTKPDYTYPKLDKKQNKLLIKQKAFKGKSGKKD